MLTAQQIKDKLTVDDVKKILRSLDGDLHSESSSELIYNTICHGGCSNKLYYYIDNKIFKCYSGSCSTFDIIELVGKVKDYNYHESISWIFVKMEWSTVQYGFGIQQQLIDDWDFIKKIQYHKNKNKRLKSIFEEITTVYDERILNIFQKWYPQDWINEFITVDTMKKFEIQYHALRGQIVIPHRNISGELIGIRVRNTLDEYLEDAKYAPLRVFSRMYNHQLGANLYGIHLNKEIIKLRRKVLLVESEKGVMQCESYFPNNNFSLALCGKNLTDHQISMLRNLNVNEVILALDKEYHVVNDHDYIDWLKIHEKIISRLSPYFVVSVILDVNGLLEYKNSPTDKGKSILLELLKNKIYY